MPTRWSRRSAARLRTTAASTSASSSARTRSRTTARRLNVLRRGSETAPLVVAVGPMLDATHAATADIDVTLAYLSTVRPFDRAGLRAALGGTDVVLVEPTLAGTSAAEVARALVDRPHRLFALGVENPELHRYGTPDEHRAAQGLDPAGIRVAIEAFTSRTLRAA